ncbi:dermatan-sulfate epimerase-like [Scyliorhinus torazame]|uniref:dermatan-sulfate epimerase-like n=1 Tax=Scyliorhinus torazame TaxID=75743 RepID=UPI003B5AA4A0
MKTYTHGVPVVFFINLFCSLLAFTVSDKSGGRIHFMNGNYDGHPMLYFTKGDVEDLRLKARSTHRHIANKIRDAGQIMLSSPKEYLPPWDPKHFSARWNEIYGNNLGVLAMFCVLFPERTDAVEFAMNYMERMASQPIPQPIKKNILYAFFTTLSTSPATIRHLWTCTPWFLL